jgi:hypothetical protein
MAAYFCAYFTNQRHEHSRGQLTNAVMEITATYSQHRMKPIYMYIA